MNVNKLVHKGASARIQHRETDQSWLRYIPLNNLLILSKNIKVMK